jgi:hypothetical protein
MVSVLAVCDTALNGSGNAPYWPIVFIVIFASFLGVDIGLTAYALWKGVSSVHLKS